MGTCSSTLLGIIQLDPLDGNISSQIINQLVEILNTTTDIGLLNRLTLRELLMKHVQFENSKKILRIKEESPMAVPNVLIEENSRNDLRIKGIKEESLMAVPNVLIEVFRHCFGIQILVNYSPPSGCCTYENRPETEYFINLIDNYHIMEDGNGQIWLNTFYNKKDLKQPELYGVYGFNYLIKNKMYPKFWDATLHVIRYGSTKCKINEKARYKLLCFLTRVFHILDRERDRNGNLVFINKIGFVTDIDHLYDHSLERGKSEINDELAMYCPILNNSYDS